MPKKIARVEASKMGNMMLDNYVRVGGSHSSCNASSSYVGSSRVGESQCEIETLFQSRICLIGWKIKLQKSILDSSWDDWWFDMIWWVAPVAPLAPVVYGVQNRNACCTAARLVRSSTSKVAAPTSTESRCASGSAAFGQMSSDVIRCQMSLGCMVWICVDLTLI